jgi:hypothetical protein
MKIDKKNKIVVCENRLFYADFVNLVLLKATDQHS